MEEKLKVTQIEIISLKETKTVSLENSLPNNLNLSYKEVGELLGKNPTVISNYVKAGLVSSIQQGSKKIIKLSDCYLLEVYFYLVENYGFSYCACKLIGALLKQEKIKPQEYLLYIKNLEFKAKITENEVKNHVNSYSNRGTYLKKKNEK